MKVSKMYCKARRVIDSLDIHENTIEVVVLFKLIHSLLTIRRVDNGMTIECQSLIEHAPVNQVILGRARMSDMR